MSSWNFLKVWIDPMQSPPYLLMLLGDESGRCQILDPAERCKSIKHCDSYDLVLIEFASTSDL